MKPLVPRSVVVNCEPLALSTDEGSAFGQHNRPRLFCDSCSIFGIDLPKALYAVEGGEDAINVTEPTAACVLVDFELSSPGQAAGLSFTILGAISPTLRTDLETAIASVKKGEASDQTIKFGKWNEKQEFKNDDAWAPAMLPAEGMVLKPIDTSSFDLEVGEGHFMGGNTAMCELAPISGDNFIIDFESYKENSISVVHGESPAKGLYPLLSIDAAAAG